MTTEYINYYVWPNGCYVSEFDYADNERDYQHLSDDWFVLSLPDTLTDEEVEAAIQQALNGLYLYA